MSEQYKLVGIEIGWNIVRVSVLSEDGREFQGYADRVNLSDVGDSSAPFLDPTEALIDVWKSLGFRAEECRISVAIGPIFSGISKIGSRTIESHIDVLEQESAEVLRYREIKSGRFVYACESHLTVTTQAFRNAGLPVEKLILAPVAVKQILPKKFSGYFALNSGVGWSGRVYGSKLVEASNNPKALAEMGVSTSKKNGPHSPLESIADVTVPTDLLDKHQLDIHSLFVSVGAAKSLLDPDDDFNLLPLTSFPIAEISAESLEVEAQLEDLQEKPIVAETNSEVFEGTPDSESISESEIILDSEPVEEKKKSGLFGKLRRGTSSTK